MLGLALIDFPMRYACMITGQSRLREIFLKTDNVISGSYLAEITKEVSGEDCVISESYLVSRC